MTQSYSAHCGTFLHLHSFHVHGAVLDMEIVTLNSERTLSISILLAHPGLLPPNTSASLNKYIITVSLSPTFHLQGLRYCFLGLLWTHYVIKSLWAGTEGNNTHNRQYIRWYLGLSCLPSCLFVCLVEMYNRRISCFTLKRYPSLKNFEHKTSNFFLSFFSFNTCIC